MRTTLLSLAVLLALGGCEASPEAPSLEADPAVEGALADAPADPPEDAVEAPEVALDAEGLRFVDQATGSSRLLAFGTPMDAVEEALEAALGAPEEAGRNEECGVGPLEFFAWGGLTVYAADGAFSGWFADERGDAPATMSGVGPGSARADLDAAYSIEVTDGSLGPEFAAGNLFGFLDDPGADGIVTGLWAGDNCFFR